MGLLTDGQNYRDSLVSKNYFKPSNPYDLNNDSVSSVLNTLQAAGFTNVRSNFFTQTLERVQDNTKLSKIAYERLAIEMGRRFLQNNINNYVINPLALFDKNSNSKFVAKREDYTITPSENQSKSLTSEIFNNVLNNIGYRKPFDSSVYSRKAGSRWFYDNLGAGQKQILNIQLGYNSYSHLITPNIIDLSNGVKLNSYVDGRSQTTKGLGRTYLFNNFDTTKDYDYSKLTTYTDSDNGSAPLGFASTIASNKLTKDVLDDYGFGRTKVNNSNRENSENNNINNELHWGLEEDFVGNSKIQRGLLHYTKNILKTNTTASKLINQTNKEFLVDGKLIYKGTQCRSWTVNDQYSSNIANLIRSAGNGVEGSVLKDGVFPHIYPKINDTEEDKRRYYFSIENLAWSPKDLIEMNVPDCEKGVNGGRLMWFPPYGIDYNETDTADWSDTRFIGRIEPVYSYIGTTRKATMSFVLLVDHPSILNQYKTSAEQFFANCEGEFDGLTSTITTTKKTPSDLVKEQTPTNSTEIVNNQLNFGDLTYYFDNNVFDINPNYENGPIGENNFGLNQSFNSLITDFANKLNSKEANNTVFEINGYASQLATNDYNVILGYKRAYSLMNYIISKAISLSTSNNLPIIFDTNENFVDDSFKEKTVNDINTTIVKFKDSARNITFNLISKGESVASVIGVTKENKDLQQVKQDRKSTIEAVEYLKPTQGETSVDLKPTPTQIADQNNELEVLETTKEVLVADNCSKFEDNDRTAGVKLKGFEQIGKFSPIFYSQTPEDFHKRLTFLKQLTRSGRSIDFNNGSNGQNSGKNSIFGRQPVAVLRFMDQFHTKILINSITYDYSDAMIDLNPEGMGVQYTFCKVTMDFNIIGGQSLKTHIDQIQTAIDFNYFANSTFYGDGYYSSTESVEMFNDPKSLIKDGDKKQKLGPQGQENTQLVLNKIRKNK